MGHPTKSVPNQTSQELIRAPENQAELSPEENTAEQPYRGYEWTVTGWDPLLPVAGQKRVHSPEREYLPQIEYHPDDETLRTKRGREVKKHDYKA